MNGISTYIKISEIIEFVRYAYPEQIYDVGESQWCFYEEISQLETKESMKLI